MNLRFLHARFILAVALVKNLILRLITRRGASQIWLRRIARENLAPTSPQVWDALAGSSRCIGCGLCDAVARQGDLPSEWIGSAARQPEDAPLARDKAERLRSLATAIARVCPAQVPVAGIAQIIDENVRMLATLRPDDA